MDSFFQFPQEIIKTVTVVEKPLPSDLAITKKSINKGTVSFSEYVESGVIMTTIMGPTYTLASGTSVVSVIFNERSNGWMSLSRGTRAAGLLANLWLANNLSIYATDDAIIARCQKTVAYGSSGKGYGSTEHASATVNFTYYVVTKS